MLTIDNIYKVEKPLKRMKLRCIFQILFLFLVMTSFASAQPPLTQISEAGSLEIAYPKYPYVEVGSDFNLHVHVFNITDYMTNETADCGLHLYDPNGDHTSINNKINYEGNFDYDIYITPGNFSTEGVHAFIIFCNSSSQTGFADGVFEVTDANKLIEIPETILYIIILVVMSLIFFVCLYLSLVIPYSNEANTPDGIVRITRKKYVKLSMILITYGMFVWLLNMILGLTENFISLPIYSGFIGFMFTAFNSLAWIVSIIIIIVMIIEWFRDINLKKQLQDLGRAQRG